MSRIGNRILSIPDGVSIEEVEGNITVKGPKGELSIKSNRNIEFKIVDNTIEFIRKNDNFKSIHGTINSLVENMIIGVTNGYTKSLEAHGVGYRFALNGNKISITAGFSHPVELIVPVGLTVEVPSNTKLIIKGIDKQLVGEFAANIRKVRPPEPYKGKGIRYEGEIILRKEGKKAA